MLTLLLRSIFAGPIVAIELPDGELQAVPDEYLPFFAADPEAVTMKIFHWRPRWSKTALDPVTCWIVSLRAMLEMQFSNVNAPIRDETKQYHYDDYPDVAVTVQVLDGFGKTPMNYAFISVGYAIERLAVKSRYQYLTAWLMRKDTPVLSVMVHPARPVPDEDPQMQTLRAREDSANSDATIVRNDTAAAISSPYPGFELATIGVVPVPPDPLRVWVSFQGEELEMASFFGALLAAMTNLGLRPPGRDFEPEIRQDSRPFRSFIFITWYKKPVTAQPSFFLNWHAAYGVLDVAEHAAQQFRTTGKFKESSAIIEAAWVWGSDLKPVGKMYVTKNMMPPEPPGVAATIETS